MYHARDRRQALHHGIWAIYAFWALSTGFLAALLIVTPLVPNKLIPLIALGMEVALLGVERYYRDRGIIVCFRVLHIVKIVLLISTVVLFLAVAYFEAEGTYELSGQVTDATTPIVPVLLVGPIMFVVSLFYYLRRRNSWYCRACMLRNSNSIDHGVMATLYSRESAYQIRVLAIGSGLLSLAAWIYYMTVYVNVNLNGTDTFVFILIPTGAYLLSLLYLGGRAYYLWSYYNRNDIAAKVLDRTGTEVRYIVISGDNILLSVPEFNNQALMPDDCKIDVPFKLNLPFREDLPDQEAANYFADAIGSRDFTLERAYITADQSMFVNMYHYIVTVGNPEQAAERLKSEWFTQGDLRQLIINNALTTPLKAEMYRLHNISMTRKTYDRHGRRLYDIRHYRPTFRLRDFTHDISDFADIGWLHVAMVNQDKHFYTIRRLWDKLIMGRSI